MPAAGWHSRPMRVPAARRGRQRRTRRKGSAVAAPPQAACTLLAVSYIPLWHAEESHQGTLGIHCPPRLSPPPQQQQIGWHRPSQITGVVVHSAGREST